MNPPDFETNIEDHPNKRFKMHDQHLGNAFWYYIEDKLLVLVFMEGSHSK